ATMPSRTACESALTGGESMTRSATSSSNTRSVTALIVVMHYLRWRVDRSAPGRRAQQRPMSTPVRSASDYRGGARRSCCGDHAPVCAAVGGAADKLHPYTFGSRTQISGGPLPCQNEGNPALLMTSSKRGCL